MERALTGAAWRSHQLLADEGWVFQLGDDECAELDRALRVMQSSGLSALQLTSAQFPLGSLAQKVSRLRQCIEDGPGVALLRGLPVDRYSREDCARIFFGLGLHLGQAMAQNPRGDLLGHVRDEGRDWKVDPTARAYQTAGWLPFHTDPGDLVALLCLRTARQGGLSSIASAAAIHDFLADERPDVLATLFEPFGWDSRGQEPAGERPWHAMPVFERGERGVTSFFVRASCAQNVPAESRVRDINLPLMLIESVSAQAAPSVSSLPKVVEAPKASASEKTVVKTVVTSSPVKKTKTVRDDFPDD